MGGSLYLIMSVDSVSRWMRPDGMKIKSETTAFVSKLVAERHGAAEVLALREWRRVHQQQLRGLLRRRCDLMRVHGLGQAATERGGKESDISRAKGRPCGSPRDQALVPCRRNSHHSQLRCQRQQAMAEGCTLGCCLPE